MMNQATLQFALAHADDDVRQLALRGNRDADVDLQAALQQIQGRQMARKKLPSWAAIRHIIYPPRLNMEQCSSEATARYKHHLVEELLSRNPGQTPLPSRGAGGGVTFLLDLTGGLGVDFAFMSPLFSKAVYVEQQEALCALAQHNFATLGLHGTTVVCADGVDYLHRLQEHATLLFLDPARRDSHGGRTYGIGDCTPNVLPLLDELLQKADYVLLKLSPMLDWHKAMSDVGEQHVEQVHIVAVNGECKELLLLLSANGCQQPLLVCANDEEQFVSPIRSIDALETIETIGSIETKPSILLEPNAALMKAGIFAEIEARFGVRQIAKNSHLFTASSVPPAFPGRAFTIDAISTMSKSDLKRHIAPLKQANITVRNFPLTVAELRRRLKLNEGGSKYIFATTLVSGEHVLLVCSKL